MPGGPPVKVEVPKLVEPRIDSPKLPQVQPESPGSRGAAATAPGGVRRIHVYDVRVKVMPSVPCLLSYLAYPPTYTHTHTRHSRAHMCMHPCTDVHLDTAYRICDV